MLRRFHIGRFAYNRPPHGESRLLGFAAAHGTQPDRLGSPEGHSTHKPDASPGIGHEVTDTQDSVHDEVKEVLEKVPSAQETLERVISVQTKVHSIADDIREAQSAVNSSIDPKLKEHVEVLRDNLYVVEDGATTLGTWRDTLSTLSKWEQGTMHPEVFMYNIQQSLFPDAREHAIVILSEFYRAHPKARDWKNLDQATRLSLTKSASPIIIGFMQKNLEAIEKKMDEQEKYIHNINQAAHHAQKVKNAGLLGGVEFFSINHFIQSTTNVVNAFKKAGEEWSTLKVAKLSDRMGRVTRRVPFGASAQLTLAVDLEHKDEEVKSNYKKFLEADFVSFHHLMGPNGLLARNKNDGNRFRAVLEYMATKGWLYNFNPDDLHVYGHSFAVGHTLPGTWSPEKVNDYVRELDNQNRAGEKKEIERGYTRVENLPDIPLLIEVLKDEIDNNNYWAVQGVVKRAIEKGKSGETSAWICTTIFRALRADSTARKFFPKGLLDKMGNIGIESPVWLTTFFKLDRDKIVKWQRSKEKGIMRAGTLAEAIALVEEDVLNAQREAGLPPMNTPALDRIVAKIVASQTVREPGWKRPISIYNSQYQGFRKFISLTKTSIKPNAGDDDFYNAFGNGGSEIQLLGIDLYQTICASNTVGDLVNDIKAKYFLEQLVHRYDELEKSGLTEEFQTYLRETQNKMHQVVVGAWVHGNNNKLPDISYRGDNSKKLIAELMRRKIISKEAVLESIEKGYAFGKAAWKSAHKLGIPGYEVDTPGAASPTPATKKAPAPELRSQDSLSDPLEQELIRRTNKKGGQEELFSRAGGNTPKNRAIALRALAEMKRKSPAEKMENTEFTVAEAREDNRTFAQIIFLRSMLGDPTETKS